MHMASLCKNGILRSGRAGFTFIEVILSIGVIGVLAAIAVPLFQSFQTKNDADVAVMELVQTLRRAQILSKASDGDSMWGVRASSTAITLFKGSSFALRDPNFDEAFDVPSPLVFSGLAEAVFNKVSGFPQATGTVILSIPTLSESRTVTINAKGSVSF